MTTRQATTLMVSWKSRKRRMLRYRLRPHITARAILAKELSRMVISLASLATLVPSPIDSPTWAAFSAGASFVPSPVTATICPFLSSASTKRRLSIGRARLTMQMSVAALVSSSSLIAAICSPVTIAWDVSAGSFSPICVATSAAVRAVSPVTIFKDIPASWQSATACGTS